MKEAVNYIEIGYDSLNKTGEELCGDKVEVFRSEERSIIVLADGLGSGVKANILATLTSKIAITMLKKGAHLEEVIDTLAHTLPVCKVRKIAYSTLTIIEIDKDLNCKIFESENPPYFFLRKGKVFEPEKEEMEIKGKRILMTKIKLQEDDIIYAVSDGAIHAGVGKTLNFGWEWKHVQRYIERKWDMNALFLSRRLLEACDELYEHEPGDDTTIVAMRVRKPIHVLLFTGPPLDPEYDKVLVDKFMNQHGRKVVCGGTAANIVARELNREIETTLDYEDMELPPTAKIQGIDLVTEGVLTLKKTIQLIRGYRLRQVSVEDLGKDGASQLFNVLVSGGTHIEFWLGKAMNSAHQNPGFPAELSIKMNVVKELEEELMKIGRKVIIRYVSEVSHEKI